ncbi:hypothetical protein [Mycobacteroides abscessus]|uniref:hypothetical protein n=1 Tax=Mycobacteroides abscessus TaxID=36809 RepID=UPI001F221C47|nr:hypothetical protein [Mycobacteroides abscessus]
MRNAEPVLRSALQSIQAFAANAHLPGVRIISERDRRIMIVLPMDQLALTLESQPLVPGSWLAETLSDIVTAAKEVVYDSDDGFISSVSALLAAIGNAMPALGQRSMEPDASIEEIVDELERAFLLSLVMTLTTHTSILAMESDWSQQHSRFNHGVRPDDYGHYLDVRLTQAAPVGLGFTHEAGPGRVHIQHIASALDGGMTLYFAGVQQASSVDNYPEAQAVTYAQWFAYIFSLWEEQFRGRIANFFANQTNETIRKSDVLVDYFGDIRLIRNDFVHNKGICKESADTELLDWGFVEGRPLEITTAQMISLIELFPRDELYTQPVANPPGGTKASPGRLNAHLFEDVKTLARERGLSDNALANAVFTAWLEAARGGADP